MKCDLHKIADDAKLLYEVGRAAVEDVLIDFRDNGISLLGRNNGAVVRNKDGTDSHIIRLGLDDVLRLGLKAIAAHLEKETQ